MENRHGRKLSPLGNLRKHWKERSEIIRKNVKYLTAKPAANGGTKSSQSGNHRLCGTSPQGTSFEPPASLPPPGNQVASASLSGELGASAPDQLKVQILQLLSSPRSFTAEEKKRLLEELAEFLTSSSFSDVDGKSDSPEPAASKAYLANFPSPFTRMPLTQRRTPQPLQLPTVPSDAATHSSFEIGLLSKHSILELEEEVKLGKRRDLVTGELAAVSVPAPESEAPELAAPVAQAPASPPLVDIGNVRRVFRETGMFLAWVRRFGLPESSLENKLPWHVPRAPFLARGLEWPPDHFASEQERIQFNRTARKRKKFLMGALPTWSFMVVNLAFIAVLVYNPRAR